MAAAQLGARAPRSTYWWGSPTGAELAAHCDRAALFAYSQITSTAAATSFSPSAFPSPCCKLTEGLILLGKEKPECYKRENKSVLEDKDWYSKIALTTPKHWHFILLMSGLFLMGDEEGQCLAPGLRGEQWVGDRLRQSSTTHLTWKWEGSGDPNSTHSINNSPFWMPMLHKAVKS